MKEFSQKDQHDGWARFHPSREVGRRIDSAARVEPRPPDTFHGNRMVPVIPRKNPSWRWAKVLESGS